MRKLLSFVAGLLTGGVVGGAVALLLTPASGKDLQTQARQRAQMIQDEVRAAAAARRAELEAQLVELRKPKPG